VRKTSYYEATLRRALQDDVVAAEYLKDALDDDNPTVFFATLKDVVDARLGMSRLARLSGLNREALYRAFSGTGNPEFGIIRRALAPLGLRLNIEPRARPRKRAVKRPRQSA